MNLNIVYVDKETICLEVNGNMVSGTFIETVIGKQIKVFKNPIVSLITWYHKLTGNIGEITFSIEDNIKSIDKLQYDLLCVMLEKIGIVKKGEYWTKHPSIEKTKYFNSVEFKKYFMDRLKLEVQVSVC